MVAGEVIGRWLPAGTINGVGRRLRRRVSEPSPDPEEEVAVLRFSSYIYYSNMDDPEGPWSGVSSMSPRLHGILPDCG